MTPVPGLPTTSAGPVPARGAVLCGGDGTAHFARSKHRIADIHYEPNNGPCWIECQCGAPRIAADSPDALKGLWWTHGGKRELHGRTRDNDG